MENDVRQLLERIMPGGRAMILAYDQGFEHGPSDFEEEKGNFDPNKIIEIAPINLGNSQSSQTNQSGQ